MSIRQHARLINQHNNQHRNGLTITPDRSCPQCHPIRRLPSQQFRSFFTWISRTYFLSAAHYCRNTVRDFDEAIRISALARRNRNISPETINIVANFRNLILTLRYTRIPNQTLEDLAYFITVTAILTEEFQETAPVGTYAATISGAPPVAQTHPFYNLIESLRRSWWQARNLRGRTVRRTNPDRSFDRETRSISPNQTFQRGGRTPRRQTRPHSGEREIPINTTPIPRRNQIIARLVEGLQIRLRRRQAEQNLRNLQAT